MADHVFEPGTFCVFCGFLVLTNTLFLDEVLSMSPGCYPVSFSLPEPRPVGQDRSCDPIGPYLIGYFHSFSVPVPRPGSPTDIRQLVSEKDALDFKRDSKVNLS